MKVTDKFYICQVVETDIPPLGPLEDTTIYDTAAAKKLVIGFAIWERLGNSSHATRWRSRLNVDNGRRPEGRKET